MDTIFRSPLRSTLLGLLLVVPLLVFVEPAAWDAAFWRFAVRWLHVLSAILLIGLLWYANLMLMPAMPRLPEDSRPAVAKVLGPNLTLWMRWSGLVVAASGLLLAALEGYLWQALVLGAAEGFAVPRHAAIGLGMWLALFMIANLWLYVWPHQRRALGLAGAKGDSDARARAARRALQGSRLNLALSLPMIFLMVAAQNLF